MTKRSCLLLFISGSLLFLEMMDASLLSTLMVTISRYFNVNMNKMLGPILWYIAGSCMFIPIVAWISKRFSHGLIFLYSIMIFLFSSLICGLSDSITMFSVSRFFQGLSISFASTTSMISLMENCNKDETATLVGFANFPGMIGVSMGPVIGSLFAHYISWKYAFYLNIPICLLLAMIVWYVFLHKKAFVSTKTKVSGKFDFLGFVTLSLSLVMISLGVEYLEEKNNIISICLILAGIFFIILHVMIYRLRNRVNILNFSVFNDVNFLVGGIVNIISRIGMAGIPVILGLLFQEYFYFSILKTGALITLIFVFGAIAKFFSNALYKIGLANSVGLGLLLTLTSLLVLQNIGNFSHDFLSWVALSFFGFSISILYTAMNSIMLISITTEKMADACNIQTIIQQLFTGFGMVFSIILLLWIKNIKGDMDVSFMYVCRISALVMIVPLFVVFGIKFNRSAVIAHEN